VLCCGCWPAKPLAVLPGMSESGPHALSPDLAFDGGEDGQQRGHRAIRRRGQPRRKMSAAGRARIAAAMKARWAKVRRAAKKATATQKPLVAAALPKASTKKAASKKVASKKTATKKASPSQTAGPSAPNA